MALGSHRYGVDRRSRRKDCFAGVLPPILPAAKTLVLFETGLVIHGIVVSAIGGSCRTFAGAAKTNSSSFKAGLVIAGREISD